MQFTLYTEKTISQCMLALNERLHSGGRSGLAGWVEKSGSFSLTATSTVARSFKRTTRLSAKVERQGSVTIIKGYVSDGVAPRQQAIIFGALVLAGLLLTFAGGMLLPGAVAIAAAFILYIPLAGDYQNSETLMHEVQRTLKAKNTPPVVVKKVLVSKKSASPQKPATAKKSATSAKKPTATSASRPVSRS